eukprot:1590570-Pleurochrysis_carterae.AAC.1
MYCQTTRARRTVSRISDVASARCCPPFEQAPLRTKGRTRRSPLGVMGGERMAFTSANRHS